MSTPPNTEQDRDLVRLRAVFVPTGQTPPPELLAGMVDIIRLSVSSPVGAGQAALDPSVESASMFGEE